MSMLLFLVMIFSPLMADGVEPDIKEKSSTLVSVVGEELIARYGETLVCYLDDNNTEAVKSLVNEIKENELKDFGCFEITDYFGNNDNKYKPNVEYNASLMAELLLNCNEIMIFLEPFGGIKDESIKYFLTNAPLRYS